MKKHVPNEYDTCEILEDRFCKDCGWPVIDVCCNGTFTEFKDANEWDWWQYCSNKGCKNHDGEGVFQNTPDWIVRIEVIEGLVKAFRKMKDFNR